jgi:hypothetical protein
MFFQSYPRFIFDLSVLPLMWVQLHRLRARLANQLGDDSARDLASPAGAAASSTALHRRTAVDTQATGKAAGRVSADGLNGHW